MKSTDNFKKTIQEHLEKIASGDPVFADRYRKEGKNINDCVTYILNTVKNSGCNGFADDEIYGMAIHYYDEDNINIGSPNDGRFVVNHKAELSDEEKQEAKEKAMKEFKETQLREMRQAKEKEEAREKKRQERLKKKEAERETRRQEALKKAELSLF